MDITLIRYDHSKQELIFAGANNPLYHIRNGVLSEYKANKQPIGYFSDPKPFTASSLSIQRGDSVYLFSDGYADQFGGPEGKKFKYAQLKSILAEISNLNCGEQKRILHQKYDSWKGNHEQVDDVLLAGIKF
jgi:serine phosphatase RsbU (regulator of sigma subunit)